MGDGAGAVSMSIPQQTRTQTQGRCWRSPLKLNGTLDEAPPPGGGGRATYTCFGSGAKDALGLSSARTA